MDNPHTELQNSSIQWAGKISTTLKKEHRRTPMTPEENARLARIENTLADASEKIRHLAIVAEQNEPRAAQMMDTFNRMGHILQIHEQRIDSLEGRRPA